MVLSQAVTVAVVATPVDGQTQRRVGGKEKQEAQRGHIFVQDPSTVGAAAAAVFPYGQAKIQQRQTLQLSPNVLKHHTLALRDLTEQAGLRRIDLDPRHQHEVENLLHQH